MSIQEFLQGAFLDMFDKLVEAVGDLDCVIGFEVSIRRYILYPLADGSRVEKKSANEPHRGYIDLKSLHSFNYNVDLHLGHMRKPFRHS